LVNAQVGELTPKDRDRLKSQSIELVKEFEQLLNVLSNKSTTSSDVQDLVSLATADEQTRIFADPKVVLEDDLYTPDADSAQPKDVSVQKYLNDWDLFYTKGFDETVRFSDLRISEITNKGYLYLKVYYVSQFKSKHRYFERNFRATRRVASIRFDYMNGRFKGRINGISFFRPKPTIGLSGIDQEFKPFIKEHKVVLPLVLDSMITESQIALRHRSDSLYAEAVKMMVQRSEEQIRKDKEYNQAINRGDSLFQAKAFAEAIVAFTEARTFKPLEAYPRAKINELTRMLAGGTKDVRQIFNELYIEGDRLYKRREYEAARQTYLAATKISPDNQSVMDKFVLTDKIIKSKAQIRQTYIAGNFRMALKQYAKLITDEKSNADWYLERALCYQAMGDSRRAFTDLNSALEIDPNFIEALKMRALSYQKRIDNAHALADYNTLIMLEPQVSEYHYRKGLILLENQEFDRSIVELDLALQLQPKDVQAYTAKAKAFRKKSNLISAISTIEEALAINPEFSSALFQKGITLLDLGEESKAGAELTKAWGLGLSIEEEKELDKYYDNFMAVAKSAARNNEHTTALKTGLKALIVKPKSADTYLFLASEHEVLGKTAEAIAILDRCLKIKETYVPAYLAKGRLLLAHKQLKEARIEFENVRQTDNRNFEACLGLGDVYTEYSKYDSALVWYNQAFSIKSAHAPTLLKRGTCHYQMENYQKALLDFENAIREDPQLGAAYIGKGKANRALRKPFDAIDNYNEAIRNGYDKYEGLLEIGQAYAATGNQKQAITSFNEAISIKKNGIKGYAYRGASHLKREDFAQALADFKMAVLLDTQLTQADCRLELAFLYIRSGDFNSAETQLAQLLNYDPADPRVNYGKAVVLYNLGQKAESMQVFETAFQSKKLRFSSVKKDPWMETIWKDEAFIQLREKMEKE